jgi:hypothetical protein
MNILITGATGLIGQALLKKLLFEGEHQIKILTRDKKSAATKLNLPIEIYEWDIESKKIDDKAFNNTEIIIHLAGENIADKRWSTSFKNKIMASRVQSLELLIDYANKPQTTIKKIISVSAIGIYGNRGSEKINETSTQGDDFLATVCKKWEQALFQKTVNEIDCYSLRVGVVLAANGGALEKLSPIFELGLGGRVGSGKQYMSWIHIEDLVRMFNYLIENSPTQKIFNATSPTPVTNEEFTKALASTLAKPAILPVPGFAIKIALGEFSKHILGGSRVIPAEFEKLEFKFKFNQIQAALDHLLSHTKNNEFILENYQWIDKKRSHVFTFFSNEKNLELITPPYLHFRVLQKSTDEIKTGTLIDYKLKLHGVPLKWRTEILDFKPDEYFVDTQLNGPYKLWHHTHEFTDLAGGTLMLDKVRYKLPLGKIGKLLAGWYVKKDVSNIFNYRKKVISNYFTQQET